MRSSYKKLGPYIREVKVKNSNLEVEKLLGVSITKEFIPSIANTIGTDMSNYKIVRTNQFAYGPVTSRNGDKISIALLQEDDCIISTSYIVFEIIDNERLLPEYLMMWFRRPEFDRYARYISHGSVREIFGWEEMCNVELPIPSIKKQWEIVKEYKTITDRIKLNEKLSQKLEETAQAIYKQWFVDFEFPISREYAVGIGKPRLEGKPYKSSGGEMVWNDELDQEIPKGWNVKVMSEITPVKDGTHDSPKPSELGYPLVTSTHLNCYEISLNQAYNISKADFDQVNKRSRVDKYDILFSMIGTVGSICFVLYDEINFAIKNVGLFKTSKNKTIASYVLFYLKSYNTKRYIEACLLGSTQSYITLTELRNIPILLPPHEVIELFNCPIHSIIGQIFYKIQENVLVSVLHDVVLGKMTKVEASE